ncbi:hypothetical protein BZA77DRAFT_361369 [Pyronema omphalodes]|nr:hypothetical protein BZA77DRAFT_361369 [Pyronema omphalodes]
MANDANHTASITNAAHEYLNLDGIPYSQTVPLSWVLDFSRLKDNEIQSLRQQLNDATVQQLLTAVTQNEYQGALDEICDLKRHIGDLEDESDTLRDQLRHALNQDFHVVENEENRGIKEYKKLNIQLRQEIANLETVNKEHVESIAGIMRGRDKTDREESLQLNNSQLLERIFQLETVNKQNTERIKKITYENKKLGQMINQYKLATAKARAEEEKPQFDEINQQFAEKLVATEKHGLENGVYPPRYNNAEMSLKQIIDLLRRQEEQQQRQQQKPEPAEAAKQNSRTTSIENRDTRAASEAFIANHHGFGTADISGDNRVGAELHHLGVSQTKVADGPPSQRSKTRRGRRGKKKAKKVPIFYGLISEFTEDWKDKLYDAIKQIAGPDAHDSQLIAIARHYMGFSTATVWFVKYCRYQYGMVNLEDPNVVYPFTWETFIRDFEYAWNTGGFECQEGSL